jgi:hypothetical protein
VVFLSPRANVELAPKIHIALHASHAALPKSIFEILVKTQSSKRCKIFFTLLPSQHKIQPNSQPIPSAAPYQQFTSHHLTFFTSQCCTFLPATFTRRTSGHYLGTCTAANFFFTFSHPPPALFFSLLSLLVFKALFYRNVKLHLQTYCTFTGNRALTCS